MQAPVCTKNEHNPKEKLNAVTCLPKIFGTWTPSSRRCQPYSEVVTAKSYNQVSSERRSLLRLVAAVCPPPPQVAVLRSELAGLAIPDPERLDRLHRQQRPEQPVRGGQRDQPRDGIDRRLHRWMGEADISVQCQRCPQDAAVDRVPGLVHRRGRREQVMLRKRVVRARSLTRGRDPAGQPVQWPGQRTLQRHERILCRCGASSKCLLSLAHVPIMPIA